MMNTTSSKKNAGAVGAKTARACDYCIRKRARWYCAADDAFLCQVCDGSVHSANPLARRHERVRLKTASSLKHSSSSDESSTCIIPSWHRGLKKKPRTPRHGKHHQRNRPPIVPDLGGSEDNTSHEDDSMEEEQLLYRVPTFDPFMVELLSSPTTTITSSEVAAGSANKYPTKETVRYQAESKSIQSILLNEDVHDVDSSSPCDFLPSDLDLAEFAADVETLLGKGLEEESFGIQELGLLHCHDDVDDNKKNFNSNIDMNYCSTSTITDCGSTGGIVIKTEEEEGTRRAEEEMLPMQTGCHLDMEIDMLRGEPFELTFDYEEDYPTTTCCDEEEVGNVTKAKMMMITREEDGAGLKDEGGNNNNNKEWKISLKLDYDAITTAWASQGTTSPWMNGQRPQINPDDSWLHSLGGTTSTSEARLLYSDLATIGTAGQAHREDGGREARVSRYKEKRRTRLFSKKIRYEVRKLNAEKRPRMKGRFVKQSSFASDQIPMFTK